MNFMLSDARTNEVREIPPERMGAARFDMYEGRRLIHVEVRTGPSTEIIPLNNPPQDFVQQLMVKAPGATGIGQFSYDPQTGWIRQALSYMAFGQGWTDARIEALVRFLIEEMRQLRTPPYSVKSASIPTRP